MELEGRVAVVTGGAGGIGARPVRGAARRRHEGRRRRRHRRRGRRRRGRARRPRRGPRRRDRRVERPSRSRPWPPPPTTLRRLPPAVQQRRCRARPSSTPWETTVNDWRWVHGVNVMGVVHGVLAFVPRMIDGGRAGPRRQHVVGRRRHRAPARRPRSTPPARRRSRRSPSALAQPARDSRARDLRASIFYPSGGLLRTGLWESDRTRPGRAGPRDAPHHRADDGGQARGHGRDAGVRPALAGPERAGPRRRRRPPRRRGASSS